MGRTKKVGSTGRFGTRYGATVRKRVKKVEQDVKRPHTCPSCDSLKVKRTSIGIWDIRNSIVKFMIC